MQRNNKPHQPKRIYLKYIFLKIEKNIRVNLFLSLIYCHLREVKNREKRKDLILLKS